MEELLKRWAGLEPELISFDIESGSFEYDKEPMISPRELQDFVHQAIEAHGWNWQIKHNKVFKGRYYAVVSIEKPDPGMDSIIGSKTGNRPSTALLEAYLRALESTNSTTEPKPPQP